MELSSGNIVFHEIGINFVGNFFESLVFHFLRQGIIVEFDYYSVVFVVNGRMRFLASRYHRLGLRFRGSYCRYLLFFYNCKFVVYAILLLGLIFCKKFYAFKLLPNLRQCWTVLRRLCVFNAEVYDLFYLFNGCLVAGFDLFLHKFWVFYCKSSIPCNVYMLSAQRRPVCCYNCLTCICGK